MKTLRSWLAALALVAACLGALACSDDLGPLGTDPYTQTPGSDLDAGQGDAIVNPRGDVAESVEDLGGDRDLGDDAAGDLDGGPADAALDRDALSDTGVDGALDAAPGQDNGEDGGEAAPHPLDDVLRINHLQALGTHNSYHVQPDLQVPEWAYTHLRLDEQLGQQGVRQVELDLNWDLFAREFRVFHVALIDARTTCATLRECLEHMDGWSRAHPAHHPVLVMLEMKSGDLQAAEQLEVVEAEIRAVISEPRVIAPDEVRGASGSLREAVTGAGWPTLGQGRGRFIFVLHAGGGWQAALLDGAPSAQGRLLFPDAFGDDRAPFAAFHSVNDPVGSGEQLQGLVQAGFLVRTRADADGREAQRWDYSRAQAALDRGAHFVSTDFPRPPQDDRYGVIIPGGAPSRCNPISAPPGCFAEAIEDLAALDR